jgi:hypothetical protein
VKLAICLNERSARKAVAIIRQIEEMEYKEQAAKAGSWSTGLEGRGGQEFLAEGGLLLVSPSYCSRFSGLRFSEGYNVLEAVERSLLCPQNPVTPRLHSLLPCYVSCMCAEIGQKMACA